LNWLIKTLVAFENLKHLKIESDQPRYENTITNGLHSLNQLKTGTTCCILKILETFKAQIKREGIKSSPRTSNLSRQPKHNLHYFKIFTQST